MVVDDLVRRRSRGMSEAQRDREVLLWIARFRFVTPDVLAERFDVTPQRINARLRRFERAGLVVLQRNDLTAPRAVFLTGAGARRLGLRPRRAPRPDTQREHELSIAELVARLERVPGAPRVLTERDARAHEAETGERCSADVRERGGARQRRWPDVILETTGGDRVAVELEFAPKHSERLRRILAGYAAARWFTALEVFVRDPAVERRIARLARDAAPSSELSTLLALASPSMRVAPWQGPAATSAALADLAASGEPAS